VDYNSPIWEEVRAQAIYIKSCLVGDFVDIITCAKFQNEIFRYYHFTGGRIFHFAIDFWMGLTTVQRYCAACDILYFCWQSWFYNPCLVTSFLRFSFFHTVVHAVFMYIICTHFSFSTLRRIKLMNKICAFLLKRGLITSYYWHNSSVDTCKYTADIK